MNISLIVDALRKGREKRPKKAYGALFPTATSACALGAIAVGFGISEHEAEDADYKPIVSKFAEVLGIGEEYAEDITNRIYRINDDSEYIDQDPDIAVITYLEDTYGN